ncbi:MAG: TRAP transporter TatT component family protein [Deltaproteobacteria bacterium]|nr:TRAP transporter TatT component family protein [Deltaproteobacteria bacterium]
MHSIAKKFAFTALLGIACLCLAGTALAADTAELIAQGDALYGQRADMAKAKQAAGLYKQALKQDPKSEEAAWKLARTEYWVGSHAPKDQKQDIFQSGVDAAKQAIAINPKSLPGHYWLGVNYGVYGSAKGVMESLSLVDPIKKEMATVIELDPNYEAGGPYRVLGRLYFKVPGIFGGDNEKAMENLKTAVKKGPHRYLNHIYLAEVYFDEDKAHEANQLLKAVIAGPIEQGYEPEDAEWKAKAKKMLETGQ